MSTRNVEVVVSDTITHLFKPRPGSHLGWEYAYGQDRIKILEISDDDPRAENGLGVYAQGGWKGARFVDADDDEPSREVLEAANSALEAEVVRLTAELAEANNHVVTLRSGPDVGLRDRVHPGY